MGDARATGASIGTFGRNVRSGRKPRNPNAARPNQPPDAVLVVTSARYVADAVVVSTLGTADPEGVTVSGTLSWGDGQSTAYDPSTEVYSHMYVAAGTYTLTLTVRDSLGAEDRALATVTLVVAPDPEDPPDPDVEPEPENMPPTAVLTYASGQFRGQPYVFSTLGTVDTDGTIATSTMNWGDGTSDTVDSIPATVTHTYANAGTYTATLTVTDDDGATATASRTVIIQSQVQPNQSPVVTVTKTSGFYTGEFTFSITATDPDGSLVSYVINPGDGTAAPTVAGTPPATYTHTYSTANASRTFTVTVTDNSGTTDSDSVTFAVLTRPSPTGGEHAYYESLIARSDLFKEYSLRSQAQLLLYKNASSLPAAVNYLYPSDPDPRQQDAAKAVIPITTNSLPNQVRLPMGFVEGNAYLVTWDVWYGEELHRTVSGLTNYKAFQFEAPRSVGGSPTIFAEVQARWSQAGALPEICTTRMRCYNPGTPAAQDGTGAIPVANQFMVQAETWTRYWAYIVIPLYSVSPVVKISLWNASGSQAVTQVQNESLFQRYVPDPIVNKMWIELNTSTDTIAPGRDPFVIYLRNVVALQNPASVQDLLLTTGLS